MRRTAGQATAADPPSPQFELDRIDVDADTVRVVGWWYGVRGRRFIRPSLTAIGGGARARALAELEHKPWSAESGQQWRAEFVWEHPLDEVEAFELAVAPDLAVRLPLPEAPKQASPEAATPGRAPDEVAKPRQNRAVARSNTRRGRVAQRHRSAPDADASLRLRLARAEQHLARVVAERDAAVTERDRLVEAHGVVAAERDRLVEAHGVVAAERDRLRDERGEALGRAATAATERARAVAEARQMVEERDRTLRERDDALRARAGAERTRDALAERQRVALAERDRLSEALEQAEAERKRLLAQHAQDRPERERLTRERDEALALRDQIAAERDRHLDQRDKAAGERDEAAGERDKAAGERDKALHERDRVLHERDEAAGERDRAAGERDRATGERDRALYELERVRRERDTALAHAERERAQARDLRDALTELRARPGSRLLSAQPTEPHVGAVDVGTVEREPVRHELPRPRGSAGQLRPPRALESPRPAPRLRPYRRMLARAIAVIAVFAVVLIVVAIVLSR